MKIYPSNHSVVETKNVERSDIPISYIMTNTNSYEIKIEKTIPDLNENKIIYPFDICKTDCYYFDKNEDKIEEPSFESINGQPTYVPTNYTEFIPEQFSVKAIIKREMSYNNTDTFNIRVACFDKATADKLITIFGDAPDRRLCPNNITVNNKVTNVYSLLNSDIEENDFVFVRTIDGQAMDVGGETQYLDYNRVLSANSNLWIGVDSFNGLKEIVDDSDNISYRYSKLYTDYQYEIKTIKNKENLTYRFDISKDTEYLPADKYTYSNLFYDEFPPILLLEIEKEGFIIISHNSFIDDIENNIKLFYEILMHVYLMRYQNATSKSSWITDFPVDYLRNKEISFLKNHEEINLTKMFENEHCKIGNNYRIINISIDNENVIFSDIDSKRNLYFSKINETDPAKNISDKTMYSLNKTLIQYTDEVIQMIEQKMNINIVNEQYILIDRCQSSRYRLDQQESTLLKIPDLTKIYYLVLVKTEKDSYFRLVEKDDYDYDFIKVAEIKTVLYNNIENIDIRKYGGGLPQNIVEINDDFNLQDISNLRGRPYRNAYSSVIKLPKRLEKYDEIIRSELLKHRAVADNLILLYEQ